MKVFALLWSLTWAIAAVSAYDLYGGYERVIYYQAYRMDWQKSGGDKTKMAVGSGCRRGNNPCDLLDFVEFISDWKRSEIITQPNGWNTRDMTPADVHQAARWLLDNKATFAYQPAKIHTSASRMGVDGLFKKMGEFIIGAQDGNVPASAVSSAKEAVAVWAKLRAYEQGNKYRIALEGRFGITLTPSSKPVGNTQHTVPTIAARDAVAKIRDLPGQSKFNFAKDFEAYGAADAGHNNKVHIVDEIDTRLNRPDEWCG